MKALSTVENGTNVNPTTQRNIPETWLNIQRYHSEKLKSSEHK
jgi:hypothetical protein